MTTRDFWQELFERTGADGVDFHPVFVTPPGCTIYQSNTKEEIIRNKNFLFPKSGYTLWKIVNGKKAYMYDAPVNEVYNILKERI